MFVTILEKSWHKLLFTSSKWLVSSSKFFDRLAFWNCSISSLISITLLCNKALSCSRRCTCYIKNGKWCQSNHKTLLFSNIFKLLTCPCSSWILCWCSTFSWRSKSFCSRSSWPGPCDPSFTNGSNFSGRLAAKGWSSPFSQAFTFSRSSLIYLLFWLMETERRFISIKQWNTRFERYGRLWVYL